MKKNIYLQKIGDINQFVLNKLKKDLKLIFKKYIDAVEISPDFISLSESKYERQYTASKIINKIIEHEEEKGFFRTLGVTEKDITKKNLSLVGVVNFVFGAARKSVGVAVISTKRLREEFYRRPENESLFQLRALKEAVHELGHTFYLKHCKDNSCVMKKSSGTRSLRDTDEKSHSFCKSCLEKINLFFNRLE